LPSSTTIQTTNGTPNEMLLFHHYNSDKRYVVCIWGNAHTGFQVSGSGSEYDTRGSIKMRITVFFEKDTLKKSP